MPWLKRQKGEKKDPVLRYLLCSFGVEQGYFHQGNGEEEKVFQAHPTHIHQGDIQTIVRSQE